MYTVKLHIYQHSFFIMYNIYKSKHAFPITVLQILCANVLKTSASGDFVPRAPYQGFAPGPHWGTSIREPPDWPVFILGLPGGGGNSRFAFTV